jgi:protein phosphatase
MDDATISARFRSILDLYIHIITTIPPSEYGCRKPKLQIPRFPSDLFLPLINAATEVFKAEPTVLSIDLPVNVIGDLHGSLLDLLRFFHEFGLPPAQSYLILGDFIDRGPFSTETMILLLLLKVTYPQHIWLIRGNHEFNERCVPHTELSAELSGLYFTRTFLDPLFEMFTWLPLAADIAHYAFAVHGGISPSLIAISQLDEIPKPIKTFQPKLVEDLLWSDPSEASPDSVPSGRGLGVLFGSNVVRKFLSKTGFQVIFRGHQSITSGVQMALGYKVATIFSASNYCGDPDTRAGMIQALPGPCYEKRIFPALPLLGRQDVAFVAPEEFVLKGRTLKTEKRKNQRPLNSVGILKPLGLPRVATRSHTGRSESTRADFMDQRPPRLPLAAVSARRHSSAS